MSDTVTIPAIVWNQVLSDLTFLKKAILPLASNYKQPTWVSEKDAVEIIGVGARTLRALAKEGKINFSTNAKGRGYKYKRTDLENYAQNFTSLSKNELKKVV
jgi:hypothetical protein